jgi:amidase
MEKEGRHMGSDIEPYSSATEMLAALRRSDVSSVELVEMHIARIESTDDELNAIPVRTPERALEAARRADEARAGGEEAALLGLPITLKESTQVAGLPQSAGMEPFRGYQPAGDGPPARRVFAAGACLLGKTNIPVALGDWQADSPIYGRTCNPWDRECTPGGSTGGGGAALAAGMTPLEVGSDIGGSIRVPAAYCGVYGHRPSETAIPRPGAFPLADMPNPGVVMGVQGPLARSAVDLELLFDVLIGPVDGEDVAWRIELPAARGERLSDFRVAIMPPLSLVQPSSAMQAKVEELASFVSQAGAKVDEAMPDVDHDAYYSDYLSVLMVITSLGRSSAERRARADEYEERGDMAFGAMARGLTLDAADYISMLGRRERARSAWRRFFADWDVLLCPTALDAPFQHQSGPMDDRVLPVDDRSVRYQLNIVYPMWAIFAGQPATAFPAGRNATGLPLGLQVIGPYLEDRTTLKFAQLLEREWQGFERPPGY